MASASRVLIVGGGPGGLAAAAALKRIDVECAVFERAAELHEVGAGLSLWSNAMTALARIGLANAVIARGTVLERALTLTADGRLLSDLDLGDIGRRIGRPSVCVHRADLQQVLAEAARPILGSECKTIAEDTDGVTIHFADGRRERGALAIGADGIRSAVRAHLHGPTEPQRAGYLAYRGMTRFELPESPPDRSRLLLGPGAQAGIFPCGGGVYWFATAPAAAPPPNGPGENLKAEAQERFRTWLPLLRDVIDATAPAAVMRHDITDLPHAWPWGRRPAQLTRRRRSCHDAEPGTRGMPGPGRCGCTRRFHQAPWGHRRGTARLRTIAAAAD